MSDTFIKFPHTPHLAWFGAKSPRADKVLSRAEADELLKGEVFVEEKVDGANLGLSVGPEGNIRAQNRGSWLKPGGHAQFDGLWAWLDQRQASLAEALGDNLILFGEWCLAVHSVRYGNLPDWFLGFDIYDRNTDRFWGVARRNELLRDLRLAGVPSLGQGHFNIQTLKGILEKRSRVGGDSLEGIYIRAEEDGWLRARAKIVRPEFTQSIGEHWSSGPVRRNTVSTKPEGGCIVEHNLALGNKRNAHEV